MYVRRWPRNFRLVVHAAQAESLEAAANRTRDRMSQRRLADAGRADETEDRRVATRVEFHHRQMFENPLLDVVQAVMVFVEHPQCRVQIERVGGGLLPR